GITDMLDLITEDGVNDFRCCVITHLSPHADCFPQGIHCSALKGPVLDCEPRRQRVKHTYDAPFVITDWKLAFVAILLDKSAVVETRVPGFVPTLTRQFHPQLPWRVGKVYERLRRNLQALHLTVAVPVKFVALRRFRHVVGTTSLRVEVHYLEALFTRGVATQ